jgi:hypothetical protein
MGGWSAIDVARDLDALERFLYRLLELVVTEVFDQHFDHLAHRLFAFVAEAGHLRALPGRQKAR